MHHKKLAQGNWKKLSFFEQMANIGSEVERAINWKNKNNIRYSLLASERTLELLYLTIEDNKNKNRLKELVRVYECLGDFLYGDNIYQSSDSLWQRYFYSFAYAARNDLK